MDCCDVNVMQFKLYELKQAKTTLEQSCFIFSASYRSDLAQFEFICDI